MNFPASGSERHPAAALLAGLTALLWQIVRFPVLALLIILEPVVRFVLCSCALIGTLGAFFIRLALHRSEFPFWGTLALSIGCVAMLALYYAAMRLFSGRTRCAPGGEQSV